MGPSN